MVVVAYCGLRRDRSRAGADETKQNEWLYRTRRPALHGVDICHSVECFDDARVNVNHSCIRILQVKRVDGQTQKKERMQRRITKTT